MNKEPLLKQIKDEIREIEPTAQVILYGSRARREGTAESDWDLLVLLDGPVDDERKDKIRHRLYEIEWQCDEVLCSVVCSRDEWNSPHYQITPFHKNIEREGILL